MWLGLSFLDWVIILAALLGIAAIGVAMSRRIHDRTDFFMGGRRHKGAIAATDGSCASLEPHGCHASLARDRFV